MLETQIGTVTGVGAEIETETETETVAGAWIEIEIEIETRAGAKKEIEVGTDTETDTEIGNTKMIEMEGEIEMAKVVILRKWRTLGTRGETRREPKIKSSR